MQKYQPLFLWVLVSLVIAPLSATYAATIQVDFSGLGIPFDSKGQTVVKFAGKNETTQKEINTSKACYIHNRISGCLVDTSELKEVKSTEKLTGTVTATGLFTVYTQQDPKKPPVSTDYSFQCSAQTIYPIIASGVQNFYGAKYTLLFDPPKITCTASPSTK